MNKTNTTTTRKTYEISQGWDGRGERVYMVLVEWRREDGRLGQFTHRFTTHEEAALFIKYAGA